MSLAGSSEVFIKAGKQKKTLARDVWRAILFAGEDLKKIKLNNPLW